MVISCVLMPCLRQTSPTAYLDSPSAKIATIWPSVNFDFLIYYQLKKWKPQFSYCFQFGGAYEITKDSEEATIDAHALVIELFDLSCQGLVLHGT